MPISDDFSDKLSGKKADSGDGSDAEDVRLEITAEELLSKDFLRLRNALYVLEIHDNLEGRLKFSELWPAVSSYVFGEELLSFDYEGTPDKIRRAWLENEADGRRLEFIDLCNGLEENSLSDDGVLQMDYVRSTAQMFGRDVALRLYSEEIVDNIFPPPPKAMDYSQIEGSINEVSPDTMYMPMLPAKKATDTGVAGVMVKKEVLHKKPPEDPINPFAKMASLPKASELRDIVITKDIVPKRGLRISWAHRMYSYDDEKQCD